MLILEWFSFMPLEELSSKHLQGAGLTVEARHALPWASLSFAKPSRSSPPQLPGVTSLLPSCGLPGRPSSSFWRLSRPWLLVRPRSVGPKRLSWHLQTPSQFIFSFVFSRRRLERTEGIRLTLGCAYLTASYRRKEGNSLLECLFALRACGVPGTVLHPACLTLTAVEGACTALSLQTRRAAAGGWQHT